MMGYNQARYKNGDSSHIISGYMITVLINGFDMNMKMEAAL